MNTRVAVFVVGAFVAGCHPTPIDDTTGGGTSDVDRGGAGDDPVAVGGKDVSKVLSAEQDALAELDAKIAKTEDPDVLIPLRHDRTARASFIAQLERCSTDATQCPPSFDEPKLPDVFDPSIGDFTNDFKGTADLWPAAARVIAEAACGCRTRVCVDWVLADLARWQKVLTPHEQDADDAAQSETLARECVWSRLGH